MIILDCEQLSPEWFKARAGLPSASCFDSIVTMKGEPSKQRTKYLYQLAGEKITGVKTEGYQNQAMLRGIELEGEARQLFEFVMGEEVKQVGLVYADEQKRYICSPDGLLFNAGLEIKCPAIQTHVQYLLDGKLPSDYFQQVHGSMLVTGYETWFFQSYYPGLPNFIIEVKRDEKFIEKLKAELEAFCDELEVITDKLINYKAGGV